VLIRPLLINLLGGAWFSRASYYLERIAMIALDSETYLMQPGEQIPKVVCVSYAEANRSGVLVGDYAKAYALEALESGVTIVMHNAAFDLLVFARAWGWGPIIAALERGQIYDTEIAEKLIDNYNIGSVPSKNYSLDKIAQRRLGV